MKVVQGAFEAFGNRAVPLLAANLQTHDPQGFPFSLWIFYFPIDNFKII